MRSMTCSSAGIRHPAVMSTARASTRLKQRFCVHRPAALDSRQQNGAGSSDQPQQDSAEDPVEAMLRVARDEMDMKVVWADPDEDEEDYLDAMEDLEDVWMRNPSPPEWAELTGLAPTEAVPNSSSGGDKSSSPEQPARGISTISWQDLQERLQMHQQQQLLIVEVAHTAEEQLQQMRTLPDPLPWAQSSSSSTPAISQALQHVQLALQDISRDVASSWRDKGVIAVLDTGHHSCFAAAIRLSAVYRLPNVVLLQL